MNIRICVGVCFLFSLLTQNSLCLSLDHPDDDPAGLLATASNQVVITAHNSPSFMLLGKAQLHDGDKSVDGLYAIAWAPGRFRRVFRFPNFSETDVMIDGVMYRQRTTTALPLLIYELETLMDSLDHIKPDSNGKSTKVERNSSDQLCVATERNMTRARVCMNSALLPVSIDNRLDASGMEAFQEHYEFADYKDFEGKQFPRTLRFRGWNSRSIQVQIDKLVKVDSFPADEFVPPAGAVRMQYCDHPDRTGHLMPSTGNAIPFGLRDTELAMYFQVSTVGGVMNAEVVYSSNPLKNKEILNWYVGTHFPVWTCAGKPIEYETIVTLAVGH